MLTGKLESQSNTLQQEIDRLEAEERQDALVLGTSTLDELYALSKQRRTRKEDAVASENASLADDEDEQTYCLCNDVSYGEMVACDNNKVGVAP